MGRGYERQTDRNRQAEKLRGIEKDETTIQRDEDREMEEGGRGEERD